MLQRFLLFIMIIPLSLFAGFPKFLSPEQAFKPQVKVQDGTIVAKVKLGENIHIYADKMVFKLVSDTLAIDRIDKPEPETFDGDKVYIGEPVFTIHLKKLKNVSSKVAVSFVFGFQGCSEAGLCYEPMQKSYNLSIDATKIESDAPKEVLQVQKTEDDSVDAITKTLKSGNLLLVLATFFGFGLLLSLTPCVFPMIPIISGLIVSQGKGITTKKAFFLSVVYVLAMAVAYTIAGVLAGLFGSNLQAALQNPFVVFTFAAIFVALALSMFGFYELKLPDGFVAKISTKGQDKGGVVGVAIMGFLSALIVGPCVAAPLAGALVYIGQTGDALLGGAALFFMSLGMGLPLILVGTGAGKLMPRPGPWMTLVNAVFGILMLGVAIWMLDKVLPPQVIMVLWAFLGLGSALYLGAFDTQSHIFKRTVAFGLLVYAIALFIGALAGHISLSSPLGFLKRIQSAPSALGVQSLKFRTVKNLDQLELLLEANKGKKIMIDFAAKWCTSCKELDEITFKDPKVQAKLKDYVLIRADVTENSKEQKELSGRYGVFGPPVVIFLDGEGEIVRKIVGYMEPESFAKRIP